MKREDWSDMATFAAIADTGSFTKAALQLGISPSAISHTIRALETRLGVRLLNRTTRSVAPTDAGEALLRTLRPALENVARALEDLNDQRDRPAGAIRISAHRGAISGNFMAQLAKFSAEYPDVIVDLSINDGLVDIVGDGLDAGIRHEHKVDKDMISVRICEPLQTTVVASPSYLSLHGAPQTPEELRNHRCLSYRLTTSGVLYRWSFTRNDQTVTLDPPHNLVCTDSHVILLAALSGVGVAYVLEVHASEHIKSGKLISLLEDWCPKVSPNYLYYPSRRQMKPALRAFVEVMRVGRNLS